MNLQHLIQRQGRDQGWLAEQLGIRKDSFSRMARGKTRFPVEKVELLAALLSLPVPEVLKLVSVPLPPYAQPPEPTP